MRRIILFLAFLVFLFLVNIIFYFLSEDYQFFLKKIKDNDEIVYIDTTIVNTSIDDDFLNQNGDVSIVEYDKNSVEIQQNIDIDKKNNLINEDAIIPNIEQEEILGKNYQIVLNIFNKYNLNQIELTTTLFDLTDEYPDPYYEFYASDITLYFFDTKKYTEVYDIFEVLAYDLPFEINTINNFGEESFYINLNEDIRDNYVRTVINYKGIVFGLKIKKSEYDTIKNNLGELNN